MSKLIPTWKVTKSWVNDGHMGQPMPTSVWGPKNGQIGREMPKKFQMFDDDGNLYFEGYATEDCNFHPLDDYGGPGFGCTYIKYFKDGQGTVL